MNRFAYLGVGISCLFLVACAPFIIRDESKSVEVEYDVQFKTDEPGNTLEVSSGPQDCWGSTQSRQGCVRFSHNMYGTVKLILEDEYAWNKNSCQDSGVQWVITKVVATVKSQTARGTKGDFRLPADTRRRMLPGWVKRSISPIEDLHTGVIYSVAESDIYTDARTSFVINNKNTNQSRQVLWYQVTATECPADASDTSKMDTKVTDPRIENEGVN